MRGGSDSSSVLDRVPALVPLLVFDARHIRNPSDVAMLALFPPSGFPAKIETHKLSDRRILSQFINILT